MSKLADPFMRRTFLAALVLIALAGCAHRVPPAQIMAEPDPIKVQDYVWEAEYDGLDDGVITEQQVGELLDQARSKWPERWEFQAMTASHYARVGDAAQAQAFHEKARVLYMENPALKRGTTAGTAVSMLGGFVGGALYAAFADDHVVEFPVAPERMTWSPPVGTTYAKAR